MGASLDSQGLRVLALLAACSVCCSRQETIEQDAPAATSVASTATGPSGVGSAAPTPSDRLAPAASSASPKSPPREDSLEKDPRCQEFEKIPLPPADQPTPAERRALAKCDAEALYYGIGVPLDFEAARKCAYTQFGSKSEPAFGGAAMLMMIYANGRGVPTNFDLAIKFACESGGAPAELELAVTALLEARRGAGLKRVLDLCDFATSGYRAGFCAGRDERLAAVEREARKAKALADLPERQTTALERAAKAFFEARTQNEVDLSGTSRAALQVAEEGRLADEYVDMLEKLRDPAFRPSAPRGTDAELEAAYARLAGCREVPLISRTGFSRNGFKLTQKQWGLYRNAWLALVAKTRRPNVGAWKMWLTEQRIEMLEQISLCGAKGSEKRP